jgi:hypothetical protein
VAGADRPDRFVGEYEIGMWLEDGELAPEDGSPTVSSLSPKYCRRSEWPTRDPTTPSSSSIGGEISPVYAPSLSQCTFWA